MGMSKCGQAALATLSKNPGWQRRTGLESKKMIPTEGFGLKGEFFLVPIKAVRAFQGSKR